MSASTALGSVSRSLRNQLLDGMDLTPSANVTLLAPDETGGGNRRVNLFLYRVAEHPQLRNAGYRLRPGTSDVVDAPPLSLVLSYLMTVYAVNDPATGNAEAHAILGEAMRVFHERPVVPADLLDDELVDAPEEVRITPIPLDPEDVSRVWSTFEAPFRLSVAYEVSVVQLDQSPQARRTIPERVRTIGVPQVRAPFEPPRVASMTPLSGPPGTVVTVVGEHLEGWRATVTVSGVEAASVPLDDDDFEFAVPAPLDPGFHQVRVDVSRLARSTSFFEVT